MHFGANLALILIVAKLFEKNFFVKKNRNFAREKMGRYIIYIIMCIAAVGCVNHQSTPVLDAIGKDARAIIIADLLSMAKAAGKSGLENVDDIPELKALARLRGVDMTSVAAVSYTPSMSAMVLSITNPKVLAHTLGDAEMSDSFSSVYTVTRETYFVRDTAWVWMVDSKDGARGAIEKVDFLRQKSTDRPENWKLGMLEDTHSVKAFYSDKKRNIYSYTDLKGPGLMFHAHCMDTCGNPMRWLPEDEWGVLKGDIAKIDPRNQFSVASGRIDIENALQSLPRNIRFSLKDAGLEDFSIIGPFNIAINGFEDFRATVISETTEEANRLEKAVLDQWGRMPGVKVECDDTILTFCSKKTFPPIFGTSYAGSNLAVVANIDSEVLGTVSGLSGIGLSGVAVVKEATLTGRIDFTESREPFLSTLFKIINKR